MIISKFNKRHCHFERKIREIGQWKGNPNFETFSYCNDPSLNSLKSSCSLSNACPLWKAVTMVNVIQGDGLAATKSLNERSTHFKTSPFLLQDTQIPPIGGSFSLSYVI